jgi:hypothetical protein
MLLHIPTKMLICHIDELSFASVASLAFWVIIVKTFQTHVWNLKGIEKQLIIEAKCAFKRDDVILLFVYVINNLLVGL